MPFVVFFLFSFFFSDIWEGEMTFMPICICMGFGLQLIGRRRIVIVLFCSPSLPRTASFDRRPPPHHRPPPTAGVDPTAARRPALDSRTRHGRACPAHGCWRTAMAEGSGAQAAPAMPENAGALAAPWPPGLHVHARGTYSSLPACSPCSSFRTPTGRVTAILAARCVRLRRAVPANSGGQPTAC